MIMCKQPTFKEIFDKLSASNVSETPTDEEIVDFVLACFADAVVQQPQIRATQQYQD